MKGYILEASPLPRFPIAGFQPVKEADGQFRALLDYQTREDEEINGTNTLYECQAGSSRYPFVLYLDGIVSIVLSVYNPILLRILRRIDTIGPLTGKLA